MDKGKREALLAEGRRLFRKLDASAIGRFARARLDPPSASAEAYDPKAVTEAFDTSLQENVRRLGQVATVFANKNN